MRSKIGVTCMIIGAVLILSALILLLYNKNEENRVRQATKTVLMDVQNIISSNTVEHFNKADLNQSYDMTVVDINGYGYIGYLFIPTLELEIPVMSEWDYTRLKIAPCRQFGSSKSDDMVIAGHNYSGHFGNLRLLKCGELITFTDMDGETIYYTVSAIEILESNQVEEMSTGDWDLTLYTCTYGGKSRVTIRCERLSGSELEDKILNSA